MYYYALTELIEIQWYILKRYSHNTFSHLDMDLFDFHYSHTIETILLNLIQNQIREHHQIRYRLLRNKQNSKKSFASSFGVKNPGQDFSSCRLLVMLYGSGAQIVSVTRKDKQKFCYYLSLI